MTSIATNKSRTAAALAFALPAVGLSASAQAVEVCEDDELVCYDERYACGSAADGGFLWCTREICDIIDGDCWDDGTIVC